MAISDILESLQQYSVDTLLPRLMDMIVVPIQKDGTLELIVPILITLFLVQLYFGRNKDESLGWNTAYGNCVVLIFVIANLGIYVYDLYELNGFVYAFTPAFYKTIFVLILGVIAFTLLFVDFFHSLDERISFFLSNSVTVSVLSVIAIVLVHSNIPFDVHTLVASLTVFIVVYVFFELFKYIIPASISAEHYLARKKRIRQEKMQIHVDSMKLNYRFVHDQTENFFKRLKRKIFGK